MNQKIYDPRIMRKTVPPIPKIIRSEPFNLRMVSPSRLFAYGYLPEVQEFFIEMAKYRLWIRTASKTDWKFLSRTCLKEGDPDAD